ncbi:PrsW family intramembrane metalloprotease [Dysosmobacter sp.]|uniref:PrsW family intramembrane metalloprotease n=1 Tax=Dysosmobacter sp. TaxID=2591382 RepID=UPI002A8EB37D|nr:PrsW family intramembrane metalloprotease [Dysosmobacter sp.]MDY3984082.1 PrsW family intramembrane metalloprotease [Dysosmobacter sp.]
MLFFMGPGLPLLALYVAAALLPAIVLLRYIYRNDTVEKEPMGLLLQLLGLGVAAALCAGVIEGLAQTVLNRLVDPASPAYVVLLAFLVVALAEEGAKLFFLRRRTWREPAFNYRFDGIVYAVFVSLGFAAFENVQYILRYGLSVALPRGLLAVPGHMSFAVVMGVFYSQAKFRENRGDKRGCHQALWSGYLAAVSLHGFYDACALIGSGLSTALFLIFVAWMFRMAYRLVKRESAADSPV